MEQIILGAKDSKGNVYPWVSSEIYFVSDKKQYAQRPLHKNQPYTADYIGLFPFVLVGQMMGSYSDPHIKKHSDLYPVHLLVNIDLTKEEIKEAGNGSVDSEVLRNKTITYIREVNEPLIEYFVNRVGVQANNATKRDNINCSLSYWDFIRRDYSHNEFDKVLFPILMQYNNPEEKYPYDLDIIDKNVEEIFYLLTKTGMDYHNYTFGLHGVSYVHPKRVNAFINTHKQTLTAQDILIIIKSGMFRGNLEEFLSNMPLTNLIKKDTPGELIDIVTINALTIIEEGSVEEFKKLGNKNSLLSLADFYTYFKNKRNAFFSQGKDDIQDTLDLTLDENYKVKETVVDDEDNSYWYAGQDDDYFNYDFWEPEYDDQMDALEGIFGFYPTIMPNIFTDDLVDELLSGIAAKTLIKRIMEEKDV